jgi:hypothetical protein
VIGLAAAAGGYGENLLDERDQNLLDRSPLPGIADDRGDAGIQV